MNAFPPFLFGSRVQLCLPTPRDNADLLAFHHRNARFLRPWMPRPTGDLRSEKYWSAWIGECCRAFEEDRAVNLVLRSRDFPEGPIIGQIDCSLILRSPFNSTLLGFQLDQEFVGRGLMREGLDLSLAYMFDQKGLRRVVAGCLLENERSIRLLSSLGFREEGIAREFLEIDGKNRDHVILALLSSDRPPRGFFG